MVTQIASDRAGIRIRNPSVRLQIVWTESLYDYIINSIKNFLPIDPKRKKKLYVKYVWHIYIYTHMCIYIDIYVYIYR